MVNIVAVRSPQPQTQYVVAKPRNGSYVHKGFLLFALLTTSSAPRIKNSKVMEMLSLFLRHVHLTA